MRDNGIEIHNLNDREICISHRGESSEIDDLVLPLKQRFDVKDVSIYLPGILIECNTPSAKDKLLNEFMRLMIAIYPRRNTIHNREISLGDDRILPALCTPYTLSGCLRLIIYRRKEYEYISKHPLYSVYHILDKYSWYIFTVKEDRYFISVSIDNNSKVHELWSSLIHISLSSSYDGTQLLIRISIPHAEYLYRVDKYYHPVIPII